jgi:hypothetical protein
MRTMKTQASAQPSEDDRQVAPYTHTHDLLSCMLALSGEAQGSGISS